MAKPKIYVTRQIFDEAVDRLREATDMKYWDSEMPPSRDELLREVQDIDGLFCLLTEKIDAEVFDAAPNLRVVSNMAVGFDNIDVAEATKRGIPVGNTPGVLTETTADFAFALLMAAGRRVSEGDRYTRAGNWKTWGPMVLLGQDIHGSTLGIIGFGRIGVEMAKRAKGFGMNIVYYDVIRNEEREKEYGATYCADVKELLAQSDFVSIHVNLTPGDPAPHKCGDPFGDEVDGGAGEHFEGAGCRSDGAVPCAEGRDDRSGGAGCDGGRANLDG